MTEEEIVWNAPWKGVDPLVDRGENEVDWSMDEGGKEWNGGKDGVEHSTDRGGDRAE